ncbi:hypothetical protein JAAARDRAFT_191827 [Jaapia argillacea MUCL 33604]|uniref:O-methyltransferase domain-containing protein n=1 Tax=Jaapia argillacea MUCL 33604 TaxID=933084 RepID=A0A067Q073_9AGAM|nr:hypothetical protein JAAARDRAFT_191827 [Jaapia argillacea MUCL 33604]
MKFKTSSNLRLARGITCSRSNEVFSIPSPALTPLLIPKHSVLHDWSTEAASKILRQLGDVLHKNSFILIIDAIIGKVVISSEGPTAAEVLAQTPPDTYVPVPPPALIPQVFGEANRVAYQMSVTVLGVCSCICAS